MSEVIFTICNISDGSHFGEAKGDPETWVLPEGQAIYRGTFDYLTHRIGPDGEPVEIVGGYRPSDDELKGRINRERDRRIAAGFVFYGTLYQSRAEDLDNIAGAKSAANDAILLGAQPGDYAWQQLVHPTGPEVFTWIADDNTLHPMDAQTVVQFGYAALTHKQGMIFKARALKELNPIPVDVTNEQYWSFS